MVETRVDILAHGLWAGAGLKAADGRRAIGAGAARWTIALAMLPDLGHALPVAVWSLLSGSPGRFLAYALSSPGGEPAMPEAVALWSHHLHCILHSGIVAALVTLSIALVARRLWLPLAGWWSHIVIDVFTHSSNFYPSPVFYPLTYWGYDGLAWNTPGFMLANYLALAVVWMLLMRHRTLR